MKNLKKYLKIILIVIGGIILTDVLAFIGLNKNYHNIYLQGNVPEQISIEKAEATKTDGRVYGYVANKDENDINGKYIQVVVYNSKNEAIGVKLMEITEVNSNDKKLFRAIFNEDGIKSYSISIVEDDNL